METQDAIPMYRLWGPDQVAQDPVELPALIGAVKSGQASKFSWVFLVHDKTWTQAGKIAELKMFFKSAAADAAPTAKGPAVKTGVLRRMKMFADMDEDQLHVFVRYMEVVNIAQFSHVVRKGDHGDAMYLVLEGELRACSLVDGKEATLSTMGVGESFGEISLLDQGPRSVDVVANAQSTLLKISVENLQRLLTDAPQAASPFIWAISKSVATRLRHLTKRYEDSIQFSRAGQSAG